MKRYGYIPILILTLALQQGCSFWGLTDSPSIIRIPGESAGVESASSGLYGNYLILGGETVRIYDISDITSPVLLGSRQGGSYARVSLSGNYAYVNKEILDLSNPQQATALSTLPEVAGPAVYVEDYLYFNASFNDNSETCFTIYNVSSPESPVEESRIPTLPLSDIIIRDNLAFLVNTFGLTILDVTDRTDPVILGRVSSPCENPNEPRQIALSGTTAYITDWEGSLFGIVDISDPSNPETTATIDYRHSDAAATAIAIDGTNLYIGFYKIPLFMDSLAVYDITDPLQPRLEKTYQLNQPEWSISHIGISDGNIFITWAGTGTLLILEKPHS